MSPKTRRAAGSVAQGRSDTSLATANSKGLPGTDGLRLLFLADAKREGFMERVIQNYIPWLAELVRVDQLALGSRDPLAEALASALGTIWTLSQRALRGDGGALRELRHFGRRAPSFFQSMRDQKAVARDLSGFIDGFMRVREIQNVD